MKIALIAHDEKKPLMKKLVTAYREILAGHDLYATGHTGQIVQAATGLPVHCFNSGPLGGDQEVGALIAKNQLDLIIFLRDPLTAQPHEPDVNALIRLADVYNVPLATNLGTAEMLLRGVRAGFADFRQLYSGDESAHQPL
ncbi:methylglyoxal synthase [Lacticaseibacillus nasuensis]|uniref:Methylglyoxal synthase n=1 Tax=Lacticaseibacillus nasuensis JCM 17158 TaxID=1291734 RepID=A0A0R1JKE9_9LACO|nr:methylglyoxal synthase [Lacticaseibacillus nasuensis]KRK71791.1 methylglyoxal synthase [Lacticaseibacillus nasuensis JCM 17158]MCX2455474.1 methylglyoxal synthase [Lacticaseibacillus nasuensis]